jgi:hypothetical protein
MEIALRPPVVRRGLWRIAAPAREEENFESRPQTSCLASAVKVSRQEPGRDPVQDSCDGVDPVTRDRSDLMLAVGGLSVIYATAITDNRRYRTEHLEGTSVGRPGSRKRDPFLKPISGCSRDCTCITARPECMVHRCAASEKCITAIDLFQKDGEYPCFCFRWFLYLPSCVAAGPHDSYRTMTSTTLTLGCAAASQRHVRCEWQGTGSSPFCY